jgi:hypothetical protein
MDKADLPKIKVAITICEIFHCRLLQMTVFEKENLWYESCELVKKMCIYRLNYLKRNKKLTLFMALIIFLMYFINSQFLFAQSLEINLGRLCGIHLKKIHFHIFLHFMVRYGFQYNFVMTNSFI